MSQDAANRIIPITGNPLEGDGRGYRLAPHNIEAEQALIGAILVNNDAYYRASDTLRAEHFYDPLHKLIYGIIQKLMLANKVVTPITLKTYLERESLGDLNIPQYLANLVAGATSVMNAEDYGRTVYDLALRRDLIVIGDDVVNIAYDSPVDVSPKEQIEDAERRLYELAEQGGVESGFVRFDSAAVTSIDMAQRAFQRDGRLSGIATGLFDLDQKMGGLQPSDLIIIAARPAMGKTSLATNIAHSVARAWRGEKGEDGRIKTVNGGIVGFFSLEMSAEQLATRVIAERAGVSSSDIRRGRISDEQFERIREASVELRHLPLYIDQTGGLNVPKLAARARRLKRQKGLDLLIVDYLQLLTGTSRRSSESRVQEITEISTGLKALAKELNVPVIALSQLSRQVEGREDKRPLLSDLRESGSIEQDADVVLFIYREEYYLKNAKPDEKDEKFSKWMTDMERISGKAEVIIGKQRHGPTGTIDLQFDAELTRFSNLVRDHLSNSSDKPV